MSNNNMSNKSASNETTSPTISRKDQILNTLLTMLSTPVGKPITTANLAKQVGITEAALYRHFASKAQMFEALIEFTDRNIMSRINEINEHENIDALEKCQHILTFALAFVEHNPGLCRILTGELLIAEKERLRESVDNIFNKIEAQIKRILREAELKQGQRTSQPANIIANLLLAILEGRIRQFSRSSFKHNPTLEWSSQWRVLSAQIML